MRLSLRIALLAALAVPLAAWAFFRPIRVLAPELAGVQCYSGDVCTDDPQRVSEALAFKFEAVQFVERKVGRVENVPRMIFCSTPACEKSFGFTGNASYNVGTNGLVVASRGWQNYFLRHELIHHIQGERLGAIRLWLFTPKWFIEGMAYSLSEDPRHPLQEPFEGFRSKYEGWASQIPSQALWSRAEEL
jgi:hypothetical protein